MSYSVTTHNKYSILHLSGEIDLNNSPVLRKELLTIVRQGSPMLVDFSELTYIDSSGIASLVEALQVSKEKDQYMAILSAQGAPLQVLQLTRLDQVFTLLDSLDELAD